MKNLLLKAGRVLSRKMTGTTMALLCTALLTILAVAVTSPVQVASAQTTSTQTASAAKKTPSPRPSPRRTPTPKPGKCEVCHNPRNPHTIKIPCDQVDKFLKNHPGDYRGPCRVTTATNR